MTQPKKSATRSNRLHWLTGDTPLLIQNARDDLISQAKTMGFQACERFVVDANFSAHTLQQTLSHGGLFAEKQMIDIRFLHWNTATLALLQHFAENPDPDKYVIVSSDKLTASQKKSKGFQVFQKQGTVTTLWPIKRQQLPSWIKNRLDTLGLRAHKDAIIALAEYTEGNLHATEQALQKCVMVVDDPQYILSEKDMLAVLSDHAQFSRFDLSDAALAGDRCRALRIMKVLHQQGESAVTVLWALTHIIHQLLALHAQLKTGVSPAQALQKIWQSQRPMYQAALRRCHCHDLENILLMAGQADLAIKGHSDEDPWCLLSNIIQSLTQQ